MHRVAAPIEPAIDVLAGFLRQVGRALTVRRRTRDHRRSQAGLDRFQLPLEEGDVNEAELTLAIQLIDQAANDDFDSKQFKDEVREKTLELIQSKVDGQEITAAPAEESKTQSIDLMAALKPSSEEDEAERKPAARAGKKKTAAKKSSEGKKSTRKKAASG